MAGEKFSITSNMSRGEISTILQNFVQKTYGFRDVGSYLRQSGQEVCSNVGAQSAPPLVGIGLISKVKISL